MLRSIERHRTAVLSCLLFVSLIIGLVTHAHPAQAARITLRVVQYNVYYGKGTDEIYNLHRQVALLVSLQPDIVSLNEVLPGEANTYKALLTSATGVTWYSHHIPAQSDGTGNQILSRHPLISTGTYFMRTNGQYSRGIAQATIDVEGTQVNFFSTHLDHANESVRAAQVDEMKAFLSGFAEPRIVAGDFNASPDKREILSIAEDYDDTWEKARAGNSAIAHPDNPVGPNTRTYRDRIDYIFYSKGAADLAVTESKVPDQRDLSDQNVRKRVGTSDDLGVRPSDHNLILAIFRLNVGPALRITGAQRKGNKLFVFGENF
ncbi:MAG TPA: endonuclease/exonuclease/phosphatase family protein, partial [Blastocatellia bacterium]|nr:endonuclease/exonuclease/phosphatase family protein [Blastocatellia bacterium]